MHCPDECLIIFVLFNKTKKLDAHWISFKDIHQWTLELNPIKQPHFDVHVLIVRRAHSKPHVVPKFVRLQWYSLAHYELLKIVQCVQLAQGFSFPVGEIPVRGTVSRLCLRKNLSN